MPDVDFLMTFPCHFLLTENGNPESVNIDNTRCICLFTDLDLVESFYKEKYGDNFRVRELQRMTAHERPQLLNTLKDWQPQLTPQNVLHVAIDATPGKRTACITIQELIDALEQYDE